MLAGFGAFAVRPVADGHGEPVAVGVLAAGDGGVDVGRLPVQAGDVLLVAGYGVVQRVLVTVVGAFGALEAGQGNVRLGFVHQQWVTGREGLDLAERQGGVADVADLAGVELAAHHLADEAGFAFEGLPHVAVEAAFGHVPQDLYFGVEVALADDAAIALGDVGRAPGRVEMVQRDRAVLDVGADAHFLG